MTKQEQFFYDNAGYSFDPKTETAEQGKLGCAQESAKAESWAKAEGYYFQWKSDWTIGHHGKYYGKDSVYADHEPATCESCVMFDENGEPVQSLGCIDDADQTYRRVIEAELASEQLQTVMEAK